MWTNLINSFTSDANVPVLSLATTLAAFTLAGAIHGANSGPRRPWLLLLGLGIGTQVAVALPGKWYAHYYQLWLPLLAVGAGWTAAATVALGARRIPRWVPSAVASAVVVLLLVQHVPLYQAPAEAWSHLKYGDEFVLEQNLGRELGALLAPGETFYEFGSETGLYFESRRPPPSGAFYLYPLMTGPTAWPLTLRTLTDLDRRVPAILVIHVIAKGYGHPILDWAEGRYVVMAGSGHRGNFALFVRRGSRLDVTASR